MSRGPHKDFPAKIAEVTGLGATLTRRVVAAGICTLEDLELAAHDGRLARIPGFGATRIARVRERLDRYLGRQPRKKPLYPRPSIELLLRIDAQYRRLDERNALPKIAPHRFNPEHRQWLPVWHTEKDGWTFTVMYSNTARAFASGKRRDWVIIVYERDGQDDHCTVVTEYREPLRDRRVVRGRERECVAYYRSQRVSPDVRAWIHEQAERLAAEDTPRAPHRTRVRAAGRNPSQPTSRRSMPARAPTRRAPDRKPDRNRNRNRNSDRGQIAFPWGRAV